MGRRFESLLTLASLRINPGLAYAIEDGGLPPIMTRRGRRINSRSSRHWEFELAARTDDGFALLARGTSPRRDGQYRIFFTNQDGVITSTSQWIAREELANTLSYDQIPSPTTTTTEQSMVANNLNIRFTTMGNRLQLEIGEEEHLMMAAIDIGT